MVVFALKLDQFRLEVLAYLPEQSAHVLKNGLCEHMAPVFGYKDQMNVNIENTVSSAPDFACNRHRPNYNKPHETTQGF